MIDAMEIGFAVIPAALAALALVSLTGLLPKTKALRVRARRTYPTRRPRG